MANFTKLLVTFLCVVVMVSMSVRCNDPITPQSRYFLHNEVKRDRGNVFIFGSISSVAISMLVCGLIPILGRSNKTLGRMLPKKSWLTTMVDDNLVKFFDLKKRYRYCFPGLSEGQKRYYTPRLRTRRLQIYNWFNHEIDTQTKINYLLDLAALSYSVTIGFSTWKAIDSFFHLKKHSTHFHLLVPVNHNEYDTHLYTPMWHD